MPTPTKGPRLGGGPAHERLMLANLAMSLFEHRRITTTVAKARRLRPLAERLITVAKKADLDTVGGQQHYRRKVETVLRDKTAKRDGSRAKEIVHVLFTEIAPAMADRPGGYTRITKIGKRKGDAAEMAVIELVLEPMSAKKATVKEAEGATKRAVKEKEQAEAAPVVEETAAEETVTETVDDVTADETETDEAPAEAAEEDSKGA